LNTIYSIYSTSYNKKIENKKEIIGEMGTGKRGKIKKRQNSDGNLLPPLAR